MRGLVSKKKIRFQEDGFGDDKATPAAFVYVHLTHLLPALRLGPDLHSSPNYCNGFSERRARGKVSYNVLQSVGKGHDTRSLCYRYRNPMTEVQRFFTKRHKGKYKVIAPSCPLPLHSTTLCSSTLNLFQYFLHLHH